MVDTNTGALAAAAWLAARELSTENPHWEVTIALDNGLSGSVDSLPLDARFTIEVFAEEWGFSFRRGEDVSWIRVTDIAFVHGRDDFGLLSRTPRLDSIRTLVRALETEHAVLFDRDRATIASNIGGDEQIATWVRTL